MKKSMVLILSMVLVFVLVACQSDTELIGRMATYDDFLREITKRVDLNGYALEESSSEYTQSYTYTAKTEQKLKEASRNFEIEIDGIEFSLPITIQRFVDLGFELSHLDDNTDPVDMNAQMDFNAFNVTSPKGNMFTIFCASKDSSLIPTRDAMVLQVSFYEENLNDGTGEEGNGVEIRFFDKITEKSSVDGIIKELKVPSKIDFSTTRYQDQSTSSTLQLEFDFSNETYRGSFVVTANPTEDESMEGTSYISHFTYLLDYDNIKNS